MIVARKGSVKVKTSGLRNRKEAVVLAIFALEEKGTKDLSQRASSKKAQGAIPSGRKRSQHVARQYFKEWEARDWYSRLAGKREPVEQCDDCLRCGL